MYFSCALIGKNDVQAKQGLHTGCFDSAASIFKRVRTKTDGVVGLRSTEFVTYSRKHKKSEQNHFGRPKDEAVDVADTLMISGDNVFNLSSMNFCPIEKPFVRSGYRVCSLSIKLNNVFMVQSAVWGFL